MSITARTTIFGNIIQFDKAEGESISHYRVFRREDSVTPSETDYIGDVPISDKPSYIDLFSDLTNRSIYRYYIKTVTLGGKSSVLSRVITASTTEVIKIGSTATLSVEIEAVNVTIKSTSTVAQTQSKTWQNTEDFDSGTLVGLSSDGNRLTLDNTTAAGSWVVGGVLNTGRRYPAGTGASMLAGLCIGGYIGTGIASLTTEEYDGTNWAGGGNLNTAVYAGAAAGTQIAALSFGGLSAGSSTEEYDGTAWTVGGAFNSQRRYFGGFGVSNNALAVGGYNGTAQASVEKYNGSTWNTISGLNAAKYALGACGTVDAGLAFAGLPLTSTTTCEEYNGVSWSVGGTLSSGRQYPVGFGTGSLGICAGGYSGAVTGTTEEYNGSGWTAGGALNTSRYAFAGSGTKGSGLCFGGLPTASMTVTEEYSSPLIVSGTWTIDLDTTADSSFGNIDLSETGVGTVKARIKTATAQATLGAASWVPATGYYTVFPAAVTADDNRWYRLEIALSSSVSVEDVTQDFTSTLAGATSLIGAQTKVGTSSSYMTTGDSGQITFVGGGAGTPHCNICVINNTSETTVTAAGTFYKFEYFTTDGPSIRLIPNQANNRILTGDTGVYLLACSLVVESIGGGAIVAHFDVRSNSGTATIQGMHAHRALAGGGGDQGSVAMVGVAILTAGETIELCVSNDTNTNNILLSDVSLSAVLVGGQ